MIIKKGVLRDGFVEEASNLGTSCWFLIVWPFVGAFYWVLMLLLGLVGSDMAKALGVPGKGAIPWNDVLPRLLNYRFNVRPFGEIPFLTLSVGLIFLGAVLLVMSRLVKQRKEWAIYPGLLIHLGVAICAVIIAIVNGGETDWSLRFGMNADLFITLFLGGLLALIYLMFAVVSVRDLVVIRRDKKR